MFRLRRCCKTNDVLASMQSTLRGLETQFHQLREDLRKMSDTNASETTQIETDVSALTDQVTKNNAALTSLETQLAAAIAAANNGASNADLVQRLQAIHANVQAATADIAASDATVQGTASVPGSGS